MVASPGQLPAAAGCQLSPPFSRLVDPSWPLMRRIAAASRALAIGPALRKAPLGCLAERPLLRSPSYGRDVGSDDEQALPRVASRRRQSQGAEQVRLTPRRSEPRS